MGATVNQTFKVSVFLSGQDFRLTNLSLENGQKTTLLCIKVTKKQVVFFWGFYHKNSRRFMGASLEECSGWLRWTARMSIGGKIWIFDFWLVTMTVKFKSIIIYVDVCLLSFYNQISWTVSVPFIYNWAKTTILCIKITKKKHKYIFFSVKVKMFYVFVMSENHTSVCPRH